MNKVAIAILNYNGKNLLEQFLPSVIKYSNGYPIYIIDNASTDDSIEFIKRQYPAIETILLSENYGYSGGYNQGLLKINATYFILLNSDIEVTENWIGPIISLLEDNDQIAACQPKILSFLEKDKFEYAGAAGGFIDTLGYPFCRGRIFDKVETDLGQYDDTREIFWATGACLFMRSSAFQESGGFDEDFFAHMEEIDLCWRLQHLGYKIFYNHQSTVYHLGGGTLKKSNPFKTYLNFRNSLYTLYKNASFISLFWKLPLRWILDLLAVLKFILTGYVKDGLAILQAHGRFILSFSRLNSRRKIIRPSIQKSENQKLIYPGLIVYAFFVKKKRVFLQFKF